MTKATYTMIEHRRYKRYPESEMAERARTYYKTMSARRTVRDFSSEPVPRNIIDHCLLTAGTAPSGANLQPWHFMVVSDAAVKRRIRIAAEKEEVEFYQHRASEEWKRALAQLGTNQHKPFLESAPYLIAIFTQVNSYDEEGKKVKHYYPYESTGIATGMLISAIHHAGLVSLTHTPSPMKFLNKILDRPGNERPFLLLVVGYPEKNVRVPDISRKDLSEIASFI